MFAWSTQDCALHFNPPLPLPSPCPPCPPWFAFLRVLRVLCGLPSPCPPPSSLLPTRRFFSSRESFHAATGASCPRHHSRQACHTGAPVEQAVLLATPDVCVEQAARLAMPAVTPAEPLNPERHGSSHAIRLARLRAPPQPAPSFPISVFSVPSVVCFFACPPWFVFLRVLRVLCGLLFPCPPTPSHNLPQIFFPFLFNHFPTPPFPSSCSYLVC